MTLYAKRDMDAILSGNLLIAGKQYCVNGDPAYVLRPWMQVGFCSKAKSHLGSHLLTPVTRLYTQHTHRHPGVASSNAMGEVTDVRVN